MRATVHRGHRGGHRQTNNDQLLSLVAHMWIAKLFLQMIFNLVVWTMKILIHLYCHKERGQNFDNSF